MVLLVAVLYALLRWALFRPMREAVNEQPSLPPSSRRTSSRACAAFRRSSAHMGEVDRLSRWQNAVVDTLNASIRAQTLTLTYKTASFALFGLENVLIVWLGRARGDGGWFQRRHVARVLRPSWCS